MVFVLILEGIRIRDYRFYKSNTIEEVIKEILIKIKKMVVKKKMSTVREVVEYDREDMLKLDRSY